MEECVIRSSSIALEDTVGSFDMSRLAFEDNASWLVVLLKEI